MKIEYFYQEDKRIYFNTWFLFYVIYFIFINMSVQNMYKVMSKSYCCYQTFLHKIKRYFKSFICIISKQD